MEDLVIRPMASVDIPQIVDLWRACGIVVAHNNPERDIQRKLKVNPEWFLVGEQEGRVVATCTAGYEGHRGWINYLAVAPELRRQGIGRRMMAAAEQTLKAAGCPKINLQVRAGNTQVIEFYHRIGFITDDVVSLGKRLEPDNEAFTCESLVL